MRDVYQIAKEREIINEAIRRFFKDRGSVEVETPMVVRSPGMEPNLVPFETSVREPNGTAHAAALITSPEYSMKKLLGLGMQKIFTITKVFRNEEEFSGTHNPEFSMFEWYEQGKDYQACMDETEELIKAVAATLIGFFSPVILSEVEASRRIPRLDVSFARDDRWSRIRVRDLFLKYVDVDLDAADEKILRHACDRLGIHTIPSDTESDLFYRLFLTNVEPNLSGNVFVYDYPKHQASLSRLTPDGKYGQRFELYMDGLEICNGFTELTDAEEQRARFQEEGDERRAAGKTVHPIDETFLNLLPSLTIPTFGNALGIDRLHMVLTGRARIEDVLLFPAHQLFPERGNVMPSTGSGNNSAESKG